MEAWAWVVSHSHVFKYFSLSQMYRKWPPPCVLVTTNDQWQDIGNAASYKTIQLNNTKTVAFNVTLNLDI